jgi:hypothetical protein
MQMVLGRMVWNFTRQAKVYGITAWNFTMTFVLLDIMYILRPSVSHEQDPLTV